MKIKKYYKWIIIGLFVIVILLYKNKEPFVEQVGRHIYSSNSYNGKTYNGNNIKPKISDINSEDCFKLCISTAGCSGYVMDNSYCYLKCLCIKDIYKLNNVKLLLGDINKYITESNQIFDFVLCSGILYHMSNPVQLIENISKITDKMFIWTHIYNSKSDTICIQKFAENSFEYSGTVYHGKRQIYQDSGMSGKQYCGGCNNNSFWLTQESLFEALNKYGFNKITVNDSLSDLNHIHGACISIFCEKN